MNGNSARPSWWMLDLIMIFVIGLLLLEARTHLSSLGHEFTEVAIVGVWVVLIYFWLHANASALGHEQWQQTRRADRIASRRITVYNSGSLSASQTAAPAQPVSSLPGNDQASRAHRTDGVNPLDTPSAVPQNLAPISLPDTRETARRRLPESAN